MIRFWKRNSSSKRPNLYREWGGVPLPDEADPLGTLAVGTVGSGKTLTFNVLLGWTLPHLGTGLHHRAVLYDAKCDMLSLLHGGVTQAPILVLNPFDTRSVAWNMALDVDSPLTAQEIAAILIPDEEQAHANDTFFTLASRDLLTGVMLSFMQRCPGVWTFRDVILAVTDLDNLQLVIRNNPERQRLLSYFKEPRTAANITSTLSAKMSRYESIAAAWTHAEHALSLKEWVDSESILVLGNDEAARVPLNAVNQVLFKRLSELLLSQPERAAEEGTHRTWIVLDEGQNLCSAPAIADAVIALSARGRSKGICLAAGFQSIEGFRSAFRRPEMADAVIATLNNICVLRSISPITAQWASDLFAKRRVEVTNTGYTNSSQGASHQVNQHPEDRPLILPHEFLDLPPTNRRNGLSGFYFSPYTGPFRETLSPAYLEKHLPRRNPDVPDFIPRPVEQLYLPPWTRTDRERLNLPTDPPPPPKREPRTSGGGLPDFKKE